MPFVAGHDILEDVTVSACMYTERHLLSILGSSQITYIQDVVYELAQVLIRSVGTVTCGSYLALLEQFGLTIEAAQSLDEKITAAAEHIELPPSWNLLGNWPDQGNCTFTLQFTECDFIYLTRQVSF